MRRCMYVALLALPLVGFGCGKTTSREDTSGNTNWLKPCRFDAECGGLACTCGLCREPCRAKQICGADPDEGCVDSDESPEASAGAGSGPGPQSSTDVPAPNVIAEHRDEESLATDMAIDEKGNVTLVGGTAPLGADFQRIYPAFWLAKLNDQGQVQGQYRDYPPQGEVNTGRSVVLTTTGTIALSTIYDGTDSPFLRYFDVDDFSAPTHTWMSLPGYSTLRSDGADGVLAVGSRRVNEVNEQRPFMAAWMGRYRSNVQIDDATTLTWQKERQGLDGSISEIRVAASDRSGNLLVGGTLGTAADSNAGEPYLARLDVDGNFVWEETVNVLEVVACSATAVAFTADGGSLAGVGCNGFWIRKYDAKGESQWNRPQEHAATALVGLADGGYAVATGGSVAKLQRFDAEHHLVWEKTDENCTAYTRLIETDTALVALAQCPLGYAVSWLTSP